MLRATRTGASCGRDAAGGKCGILRRMVRMRCHDPATTRVLQFSRFRSGQRRQRHRYHSSLNPVPSQPDSFSGVFGPIVLRGWTAAVRSGPTAWPAPTSTWSRERRKRPARDGPWLRRRLRGPEDSVHFCGSLGQRVWGHVNRRVQCVREEPGNAGAASSRAGCSASCGSR